MITSSNKTLIDYLQHHDFTSVTNATSAIAVVLLLAIVIEREVVRMNKPELARRNVTVFGIIAMPMAFVFAAIILLRFIRLS
jgi:hypothetical protein